MRLRKIEAFKLNKTQLERQKPKKGLSKPVKFIIFVLIMLSPLIVWKAITFNAVYANGIVMGQLELEMTGVKISKILSGVDGEITELYGEKGQRVKEGSVLAVIKVKPAEGSHEYDSVEIRSQGDEVIVSKRREIGDFVKNGDVVYGVLPVGTYWIEVFIPEKYIDQLYIGQKAIVFTSSPRRKFAGKVDFISAEVETMPKIFSPYHFSPKRVFVARISLADKNMPPGLLKFGMTVKCKMYKK